MMNMNENDRRGSIKQETPLKIASNFRSVYFLGLAVALGQQFQSWNYGLNGGFWIFFGATLFVASGYLCLMLCLAEMTSTLPFSGGSYGFARVTLGPFWGYMMGVADSIEFTLRTCMAVAGIGDVLVSLQFATKQFQSLYWIIAYLVLILLINQRGKSFWSIGMVLAVLNLLIITLYVFSTTPLEGNFNTYVTEQETLASIYSNPTNTSTNFIAYMPLATDWYMGLECLPLACSEVMNARENVPKAMLYSFGTLFVTSLLLLFTVSAQSPGVRHLTEAVFPLSYGFSDVYGISLPGANLFTLPAVLATAYGYTFAFSKQMVAMAKSRLFLVSFTKCCGEQYFTLIALMIGALIGLFALLLTSTTRHILFSICLMGGMVAYIGNFVSFIIFRNTYGSLKRDFINPLGIYSAVYGICVFLIIFFSASYYQQDNYVALLLFGCWVTWAFLGYYCLSRRSQVYSQEEQAIMFVAYVIKANKKKRHRIVQKAKQLQQQSHHDSMVFNCNNHHHYMEHGDSVLKGAEGAGGHPKKLQTSEEKSSAMTMKSITERLQFAYEDMVYARASHATRSSLPQDSVLEGNCHVATENEEHTAVLHRHSFASEHSVAAGSTAGAEGGSAGNSVAPVRAFHHEGRHSFASEASSTLPPPNPHLPYTTNSTVTAANGGNGTDGRYDSNDRRTRSTSTELHHAYQPPHVTHERRFSHNGATSPDPGKQADTPPRRNSEASNSLAQQDQQQPHLQGLLQETLNTSEAISTKRRQSDSAVSTASERAGRALDIPSKSELIEKHYQRFQQSLQLKNQITLYDSIKATFHRYFSTKQVVPEIPRHLLNNNSRRSHDGTLRDNNNNHEQDEISDRMDDSIMYGGRTVHSNSNETDTSDFLDTDYEAFIHRAFEQQQQQHSVNVVTVNATVNDSHTVSITESLRYASENNSLSIRSPNELYFYNEDNGNVGGWGMGQYDAYGARQGEHDEEQEPQRSQRLPPPMGPNDDN